MQPRAKRLFIPKIKTILVVLFAGLAILLLTKSILFIQRFMHDTGLTPKTVANLLFDGGVNLMSHDGATNILVLGMGGGDHVGSDLTDTMIVVSIRPSEKRMAIITLPRDVWSETLRDRINSAYHYGEEKKTGGGTVLAKSIVEEVTGLPIHYTFLIDFTGFKEIIDRVGGVNVVVHEAFTDSEFPILGRETDDCGGDKTTSCRYETIHFDAGMQTMNGDTALKYVRSRHAEGTEGSDFARGKRQQDVLLALKQKLMKPELWMSVANIKDLTTAFDRATETDMNIGELATVGKIARDIEESNIKRISIQSQLYEPPIWRYGRYVLIPSGGLESIHSYIQEELQK